MSGQEVNIPMTSISAAGFPAHLIQHPEETAIISGSVDYDHFSACKWNQARKLLAEDGELKTPDPNQFHLR